MSGVAELKTKTMHKTMTLWLKWRAVNVIEEYAEESLRSPDDIFRYLVLWNAVQCSSHGYPIQATLL